MRTVVAMVTRCRADYVHVVTKDSAVTGVQLFQHSSCLPCQYLLGCGNWRRSAIKQFLLLAFNCSSDRILLDAADDRLVAGVVEWLIGEVLLISGLIRSIRDRRRSGRSSGGLWQS